MDWITETRSRTRSSLTRSDTASLTRSQPRNLLSMATLNKAGSCRLLPSFKRVWIAQTCFGSKGRFWPMIRPLFQALRFGGSRRKLDSWHDLPSDPPSNPSHQHRADFGNLPVPRRVGFHNLTCNWCAAFALAVEQYAAANFCSKNTGK